MPNKIGRKLGIFLAIAVSVGLIAAAAGATSLGNGGDGASGPWADHFDDFDQGPQQNGAPIKLIRSEAAAALGPAELTGVEGTFVSLGFEGAITLEFDNYICNGPGDDIEVWEVTWGSYPLETVDVYASQDGNTFHFAGTADNINPGSDLTPSTVALPASMPYAKYVKLIDTTDPANFSNRPTADGYDLDGVKAIHSSATGCTIEVEIDVKPGSDPNSINLCSNGVTTVAVFGSPTFDVMKIKASTVEFAGASIKSKNNGVPNYSYKDINFDGHMDFVAHFQVEDLDFNASSTQGVLIGETKCGLSFQGVDSVRIILADCDNHGKNGKK